MQHDSQHRAQKSPGRLLHEVCATSGRDRPESIVRIGSGVAAAADLAFMRHDVMQLSLEFSPCTCIRRPQSLFPSIPQSDDYGMMISCQTAF